MSRQTMMNTRTTDPLEPDLEAILEAFEGEEESTGSADLAEYLPASTDPRYCRIAVELIRVDLERSRARGVDKRLEDYQALVSHLFDDPQCLNEIAYEEYRLRRQAGEHVDVSEYIRRFGLDTSSWRVCQDEPADGVTSQNSLDRAVDSLSVGARFPTAGERFADFDLVEQLGRGAFGIVFRARQHDLAKREVVLKITASRSVEPQRLARLQHTNIVPIYSVHHDAGLLGICMPFLGRRTLADVLPSERPRGTDQARLSTVAARGAETIGVAPPVEADSTSRTDTTSPRVSAPVDAVAIETGAAINLVAQLAEGLSHAHCRGIVHSDLKPANVLLSDDGTPLLLDFNLSGDSCATQRATLLVGGTFPYMAPEHLQATLDGGPVPAHSDLFSLGVIFFELLTGQRPFPLRGGSFDQTVAAMIHDRRQKAPSVRSLNPAVSPAVAAIVARCLAPNFSDRYAHAAELVEDLRRHQADLPLRHVREPSLGERGGKWLRRHARGVRAAALVTLVAALVGISALYAARQNRLANIEAVAAYTDFENDALTANLNLHAPGTEPELHAIGRAAAEHALQRFGLLKGMAPADHDRLSRLTPQQQAEVRVQAVRLLFTLASSTSSEASANAGEPQSERWVVAKRYNAAAMSMVEGQSTALMRQQARLGAASGHETPAVEVFQKEQLAQVDDNDAYLEGIRSLEDGDYGAATRTWERLCKKDRRDPVRWLLLGNSYVGVRRLAAAEACYTAVIALQPKAMAGYYYRGLCRFQQDQYVDAEQDFTAAIELRPGCPAALLNRALVWEKLGAYQQAERDASAAIDAGMRDPRAFFVRALIRNELGNFEGARADRERGLELPPVDDKGWVARGMAVLRDDPEQAREQWTTGLNAFPHSYPLLQNLVHVYGDRLQQPELALEKADQLVEWFPDDPAALGSRAVLHARLGDRAAAHRYAERIADGQPAALTSLQLACVYALTSPVQSSDVEQALHHLQQALSREPRLAARAAADPDLETIRSTPEFSSLIAAANRLTGVAQASPRKPSDAASQEREDQPESD